MTGKTILLKTVGLSLVSIFLSSSYADSPREDFQDAQKHHMKAQEHARRAEMARRNGDMQGAREHQMKAQKHQMKAQKNYAEAQQGSRGGHPYYGQRY